MRCGIDCLLSTVHDPHGHLLPAIQRWSPALEAYGAVYVTVTTATDEGVLRELRGRGVEVETAATGLIGESRRRALHAGYAAKHTRFLYCDFDRWLHWICHFTDELKNLPHCIARCDPSPWYVCLGRSTRAFATHPTVQRLAEGATNRALSLAVGQRIDATAGACWLSQEGAELVLAGSSEPTNATDLEWPALIHRADPRRLASIVVEGLEFETAGSAASAIAAAGGRTAWMRATYDRPEVWAARLRLAADAVAALARVLSEPTGDTRLPPMPSVSHPPKR
jgi:hypothetical protein